MEESLGMLRALGDRAELGLALEGMGCTHFASGAEDEGRALALEDAIARALATGSSP